jgi:hypothetical protein
LLGRGDEAVRLDENIRTRQRAGITFAFNFSDDSPPIARTIRRTLRSGRPNLGATQSSSLEKPDMNTSRWGTILTGEQHTDGC